MRRVPRAYHITEMVAERKLREIEREMEQAERDGMYFTFEQFVEHKAEQERVSAPRRKQMRAKFQERWKAKRAREAEEQRARPSTRSRRARHG